MAEWLGMFKYDNNDMFVYVLVIEDTIRLLMMMVMMIITVIPIMYKDDQYLIISGFDQRGSDGGVQKGKLEEGKYQGSN